MPDEEFFTFREYMKKEDGPMTACMEDYLEMIYRLSLDTGFTRIHDLAASLNVQPPSATKMVQKLAEAQLVNYEKYGMITLSQSGQVVGKQLLERHEIVENFLRLLGVKEALLEETEKIEHTLSEDTLACLKDFVVFLNNRPKLLKEFSKSRKKDKPG
ncbi:MAG: transcriptional regulator MntR [Eubacteriales bacterium]